MIAQTQDIGLGNTVHVCKQGGLKLTMYNQAMSHWEAPIPIRLTLHAIILLFVLSSGTLAIHCETIHYPNLTIAKITSMNIA